MPTIPPKQHPSLKLSSTNLTVKQPTHTRLPQPSPTTNDHRQPTTANRQNAPHPPHPARSRNKRTIRAIIRATSRTRLRPRSRRPLAPNQQPKVNLCSGPNPINHDLNGLRQEELHQTSGLKHALRLWHVRRPNVHPCLRSRSRLRRLPIYSVSAILHGNNDAIPPSNSLSTPSPGSSR